LRVDARIANQTLFKFLCQLLAHRDPFPPVAIATLSLKTSPFEGTLPHLVIAVNPDGTDRNTWGLSDEAPGALE